MAPGLRLRESGVTPAKWLVASVAFDGLAERRCYGIGTAIVKAEVAGPCWARSATIGPRFDLDDVIETMLLRDRPRAVIIRLRATLQRKRVPHCQTGVTSRTLAIAWPI